MPLTLVQLLAARGMAPVDLQAAEARRVKLGGGLETSLLELGVLEEAKVGELWSEASRLPRPPPDLVLEVTSANVSLFPQQLAERYGMVPLGLVRRQLSLLVRHPVDLSTVDEISFLLSRPLKLYVGTELEIAELLGKVYGLQVPERLQNLRLKLQPGGEVRRVQTPQEASFAPPAEESPAPIYDRPAANPAEPIASPRVADAATPPEVAIPEEAPEQSGEQVATAAEPEVAPPQVPSPAAEPAKEPEPLRESEPPGEPAPIVLPMKRSVSPEPWSINLPLVEPPSASRRSRPPLEMPRAVVTTIPVVRAFESPPTPEPVRQPVAAALFEPLIASTPESVPEPAPVQEALVPAERVSEQSLVAPALAEAMPALAATPTPEPAPYRPVASAPESPAPEATTEAVPSEPLSETTHLEATPLSSGYGGRAGPEPRMTATEALAALRLEETRDGVIGVAVDFMRGAFDFVAVFVRREDTFEVFEATGIDYGGGADLSQTAVDLERSKVLRMVVDGKAPYVGPIPAWDPLEGALGALGRGRLRAVLMYPVVIRDRTIAVIHGDRGGEALAPRQLSDVALVLSQLGAQLERVIRARRKQGARSAESKAERSADLRSSAPPVALPAASAPQAMPQAPPEASPEAPATVSARVPVAPSPAEEIFFMAPPLASPAPSPATSPAAFLAASGPGADEPSPADHEEGDEQGEPFEVPIDWVEFAEDGQMVDHVRAFLSGDPPARAQAAALLRAGGEDAAWALAERFPGPLFVFRMTLEELPAPDAMGPVVGLMAALGPVALPALSDLTESSNEEKRFWATVLIAKTGDNTSVPVLARRLLDASPEVALAARRGLWRLRKAPEFASVLEHATSELASTDPERSIAIIRALGQFHHVSAIPHLIQLVTARDSMVSQAANEALREIARQDFGTSERRWNAWWEQARQVPRIGWVIEALEDRDRDLRLAAISELTELTGFDLGYRSDLEPGKQGPALQRWRDWLEREGRTRATPAPLFAAS